MIKNKLNDINVLVFSIQELEGATKTTEEEEDEVKVDENVWIKDSRVGEASCLSS